MIKKSPCSEDSLTFVLVSVLLRLCQSYAINDASMVELIAEQSILLRGEYFKQTSVGIEAAGVEYGIVTVVELSYLCLQLSVYVLQGRKE